VAKSSGKSVYRTVRDLVLGGKINPKPESRQRQANLHLAIGTLGLVCLVLVFKLLPGAEYRSKPEIRNAPSTSPPSQIQNEISLLEQRDRTTLLSIFFTGLGLTLSTVAFYEVMKIGGEHAYYRFTGGQKFDRFFGEGASEACVEAMILLQADSLEAIMSPPPQANQQLKPLQITSDLRCFKARDWVNKWDTDGARYLRERFRLMGLHAPQLIPADHSKNLPARWEKAPFIVALGLGFTDQTHRFSSDLREVFRIDSDSPLGDCLKIRHEYVERYMDRGVRGLQPSEWDDTGFQGMCYEVGGKWFPYMDSNGFVTILPEGKDSKSTWHFDDWKNGPESCNDYAVILRREADSKSGPRQSLFVVGGFTERGTAIGAEYLGRYWEDLADRFGDEDFLVILTGRSQVETVGDWKISLSLTKSDVNKERRRPGVAVPWPTYRYKVEPGSSKSPIEEETGNARQSSGKKDSSS
jgi:hypothetical protein